MKRDPRLHGLSSEHHHALVLARALERRGPATWTGRDAAELGARFQEDLEPHFQVEETLLLPALRAAGQVDLTARVEEDHARLRSAAAAATAGDGAAAHLLGTMLTAHVRFEERDLFSACEALLGDAVLDEVARRSAKGA
ncbi:MAG: hemerythrin domain-containing protein [Byssovorax sp.]